MAKVRIKGLNIALRNVRKQLQDAASSKRMQKQIGEFVVGRIVQQARSGKNEKSGKALPKLSKSYLAMRLGLVKFRTSSSGQVIPIPEPDEILKTVDKEFFEPTRSKSNLTFTGELLRSLGYSIEKNSLFIKFTKDVRRDGKRNSKIYKWLKQLNIGYDFIGLGKVGKRRVRKMVLDEFRRKIRGK